LLPDFGKGIEEKNQILKGVFTEFLFKNMNQIDDDILDTIINSFDFINFVESGNSVLEGFIEWYLDNFPLFGKTRNLRFYTPASLRKLFIQLADVKNRNDIFDMCSGIGSILTEAAKINPELKLYGKEEDPHVFHLSKINLILHGKTDFYVEQGDVLTEPITDKEGKLKKFDAVVGDFPFAVEIRNRLRDLRNDTYGRFNFIDTPSVRGDWFFVQHAIAATAENGICILLVTRGSLGNAVDESIRRRLIEEDIIEAIIDLPPKILEETSIATSIMVINKKKPAERKNKVLVIDASDKYIESRRVNILSDEQISNIVDVFREGREQKGYSRFVGINEIRENAYRLDTKYYIRIHEMIEKIPNPQRLRDVSQIFRGLQIRADEIESLRDDNSPYYLLDIGGIQDGEINLDSLTRISIRNHRWLSLYLLQEGDVIVSGRGTTVKVAVIEKDMSKLIISGNLICIRLNRKLVNPYFLKIYLESEVGKALLEAIHTGSVIMVLNPRNLGDILIPTVDIEMQNEIAELYVKAKKQYKAAVEKAEKEFSEAMKNIYQKLDFK
jgi:type I restriction enzyme M protein